MTERVKPLGLGWPNIVSIARIASVPFLLWLMTAPSDAAAWGALVLFLAGAGSDKLDGYLARRHQVITPMGAWLDPLADKLFVLAPMVVLVVQDRFPWWAAAVIVAREIAVSLLRHSLHRRSISMPASPMGKAKTVVQLVAIGAYLVPGAPPELAYGLLVAAVVVTVASGVEYFVGGVREAVAEH